MVVHRRALPSTHWLRGLRDRERDFDALVTRAMLSSMLRSRGLVDHELSSRAPRLGMLASGERGTSASGGSCADATAVAAVLASASCCSDCSSEAASASSTGRSSSAVSPLCCPTARAPSSCFCVQHTCGSASSRRRSEIKCGPRWSSDSRRREMRFMQRRPGRLNGPGRQRRLEQHPRRQGLLPRREQSR